MLFSILKTHDRRLTYITLLYGSYMARKVEFGFRVWVRPEGDDPPEIEVWFQGLEPTESV